MTKESISNKVLEHPFISNFKAKEEKRPINSTINF